MWLTVITLAAHVGKQTPPLALSPSIEWYWTRKAFSELHLTVVRMRSIWTTITGSVS